MKILVRVLVVATLLLVVTPLTAQVSLTTAAYSAASIPDALGGNGSAMHTSNGNALVNQGLEYDDWLLLPNTDPDFEANTSLITSARRQAMNSIPDLYDWAIWDPSGRGDDHPNRDHVQGRVTTNGGADGPLGAYHSGEQVEWLSMFSDATNWGVDSADGLGADLFLSTDVAPLSSNSGMRATVASGTLGLRLNAAGAFTLGATLPDGHFLVHLLVDDSSGSTGAGLATFDGSSVAIPLNNAGDQIHTLDINNTNGSQDLEVVLGNLTTGNYRFAGVVVQTVAVPEPGSVLLMSVGGLMIAARRRRG